MDKNELIAVQFNSDLRPFSAITRGGYIYDIEYSRQYGYMYCMSGVGFPRPLSLAGDWWLRAGVPYVSAGPVRLLSQDAVSVETMEDLVSLYDMMEADGIFYDCIANEHYPDGEESPYTYWNNELEMRAGPGADEPCHDFHKTAVLAFVNAMGAEFRAAVIAALRGEAAWPGQSPAMREAHYDAGYRWLACLLPPQEAARDEIDRTLGWLENGGYVNG